MERRKTNYKYQEISEQILNLDKKGKFLNTLMDQLDPKAKRNKERISKFQSKELSTPLPVAAAIRHIFAHGKLTPNANDTNPKKVGKICVLLSNLMKKIMDTEFEKKIDSFYDEIKSKAKKKKTI